MNLKTTGTIDEPQKYLADDTLNISPYAVSLEKFIRKCDTPITIGLQGEWGSGKTTLSNMIYNSIEEKDENIMQIWINAWEYSLFNQPKESLMLMLNKIIDVMVEKSTISNKAKNMFKDRVQNVGKGVIRFAAGMTGGRAGADVARELTDSFDTISSLRKEIEKISNEIIIDNKKIEKIVIYVDDLDRINPSQAVSLLEVFKNVLCIPRCVFVLAIDYDVVVKGLQEKFGDNISFEEWEYKAFFDKIIQLAFTMPMSQYDIGKYVNNLLVDSGFLSVDQKYDKEISSIISWTIGKNPRSIKRLCNSLSLIDIFTQERKDVDDIFEDEDLLVIALVCLQIEYFKIYELFLKNPDFRSWDQKNFAFSVTKKEEEENLERFNEDLRIASMSDNFDEEWEKVIFRVCYNSKKYRQNAEKISKLLSFIDHIIFENLTYEETISAIKNTLNKTSLTSIKT